MYGHVSSVYNSSLDLLYAQYPFVTLHRLGSNAFFVGGGGGVASSAMMASRVIDALVLAGRDVRFFSLLSMISEETTNQTLAMLHRREGAMQLCSSVSLHQPCSIEGNAFTCDRAEVFGEHDARQSQPADYRHHHRQRGAPLHPFHPRYLNHVRALYVQAQPHRQQRLHQSADSDQRTDAFSCREGE
jgi:hypothetical protein